MAKSRTWRAMHAGPLQGYRARGMKCVLWRKSVKAMRRDELIAFIGFLDECATERATNPHWPGKG